MTASTPLADHIYQHIMDFRRDEFRFPTSVAVHPKRLQDLVLETGNDASGPVGSREPDSVVGTVWTIWGLPLVTIDRREADMVACICQLTG